MSEGNEPVMLPRWALKEAARRKAMGNDFDPREADIIAQWPEGWRKYHTHGLECIVMSGRVASSLFIEPPSRRIDQVRKAPWIYFVAGRLLAGVGTEILLKGLYLKSGYSIRKPDDPRKQSLAQLGPQARQFDPHVSASFGTLLRTHNLSLLGNPVAYKPLIVAKWWRDEAAHSAMTSTGDAGIHLCRFGIALRLLHDALLKDADAQHAASIEAILRDRRPILIAGLESGA
jgi:hypothetical protein